MSTERQCYGKMFPSVVEMRNNQPVAGKVFGYELSYSGQVAHRRCATVNRAAWEECLKCPSVDHCYRLSTGTMLMELVVNAAPTSQYR